MAMKDDTADPKGEKELAECERSDSEVIWAVPGCSLVHPKETF